MKTITIKVYKNTHAELKKIQALARKVRPTTSMADVVAAIVFERPKKK